MISIGRKMSRIFALVESCLALQPGPLLRFLMFFFHASKPLPDQTAIGPQSISIISNILPTVSKHLMGRWANLHQREGKTKTQHRIIIVLLKHFSIKKYIPFNNFRNDKTNIDLAMEDAKTILQFLT